MNRKPGALLVATMDTKGQEALYLKACLQEQGVQVFILDASLRGQSPARVSVTPEEVARAGGRSLEEIRGLGHEGQALAVMAAGAVCCARDLVREGRVQGIIGLGGSMGTTLGTAVMRAFPLGLPKVMISTMASRDTRPFVGTRDIFMLYSVCDLSGLNRLTRKVLRNGALALAGMVRAGAEEVDVARPLVALSTLGTTQACALEVRRLLEERGREVVIFHTVGSGGAALEEMIQEGEVEAVVDLSLQELAAHRFGGDYDAGPERGRAAGQKGLPVVLVPGNIDFLGTGPEEQARRRFPGRASHVHTAAITCVRTSREEVEELARVVAEIARAARGPVAVVVPLLGFSAFDHPQGPLADPEAPRLFGARLQAEVKEETLVRLVPAHINDPAFAAVVVETLAGLEDKPAAG